MMIQMTNTIPTIAVTAVSGSHVFLISIETITLFMTFQRPYKNPIKTITKAKSVSLVNENIYPYPTKRSENRETKNM